MSISQGFRSLPGYFEQTAQTRLLEVIRCVIAQAPLYIPAMPKTGKQMSVRMTNCGPLGITADQDRVGMCPEYFVQRINHALAQVCAVLDTSLEGVRTPDVIPG
jgi:alkylated DNA repair dioxygenase AlkB